MNTILALTDCGSARLLVFADKLAALCTLPCWRTLGLRTDIFSCILTLLCVIVAGLLLSL